MYASTGTASIVDFRVHGRRRPRSPWPARLARVAAVLVALAILSLGFARVAEGGTAGPYESVTVQPGDTLWSIAAARYPGADVRTKVFQIEQANHRNSPAINAGERIQVPTH